MKKVLIISFLIFTILISFFSTSYATITITDESLETSYQEILKEVDLKSLLEITSLTIDKTNKQIKIIIKNVEYVVNYNLSDKPTFSIDTIIDNTTTYDKWENEQQTQLLSIPAVLYAIVANLNGIPASDSLNYFTMQIFFSSLDNSEQSSNSGYTIIKPGENILSTNTATNVILSTDFPKYAVDIAANTYASEVSYSDADENNTFKYATSIKEKTEDKCVLQSVLTINLDGNFSDIKGYSETNGDILQTNITKDNADYVIELKKGQKCKIESNVAVTGYSLSGSSCIDINDDKTEISAVEVGSSRGYLLLGQTGNIKKSIYVAVEENTENNTLEPITLKIKVENVDSNLNTDESNLIISNQNVSTNLEQISNNLQQQINTLISTSDKLPQTGDYSQMKNGLYLLCIVSCISLLFLIFKTIKYKNIEK